MMARLALQDALQYRVESAIFFLSEVIPPFMMAYFWLIAFESQSTVAGYALGEMLTYSIASIGMRGVISSRVEWALDWEIREGTLSTQLTRPYNFWGFLLVESLVSKATRLVLLVGPATVVGIVWLGPQLSAFELPWDRAPLLAISVALAFVTSFFVKLCVGCVGFWTNDIGGVVNVYDVINSVMGGILVPITLLPDGLQIVAQLMPTYAIYTVPLSILLGKADGVNLWLSIGLQLVWIVVLWGLAMALWRVGLRRYESVGG